MTEQFVPVNRTSKGLEWYITVPVDGFQIHLEYGPIETGHSSRPQTNISVNASMSLDAQYCTLSSRVFVHIDSTLEQCYTVAPSADFPPTTTSPFRHSGQLISGVGRSRGTFRTHSRSSSRTLGTRHDHTRFSEIHRIVTADTLVSGRIIIRFETSAASVSIALITIQAIRRSADRYRRALRHTVLYTEGSLTRHSDHPRLYVRHTVRQPPSVAPFTEHTQKEGSEQCLKSHNDQCKRRDVGE